MNRLPRWLKIVGLVFGALILLALIIPFFIPVEKFRGPLISSLEEATGHKVGIGKISLHLIPTLGFSVEDVHILNPEGFPAGDVIAADALRGSLAWGPLLGGNVQVTSLELAHPRAVLLTNERGATNYEFKSKKSEKAPSSKSSATSAEVDSIELSKIEISAGSVSAGAREAKTSFHLAGLTLQLRNLHFDSSLVRRMEAESDLSGVKMDVAGINGTIEMRSGKVTVGGGRASGEFIASLGKAGEVKGKFDVPDLEKPGANFAASSPELDVDRLLAAGGSPSSGPSARSEAATGPSALLAQGTVTAEKLRWAPYEGTNARAEVRLYSDKLEASPITMNLYGGTVSASFTQNSRTVPAHLGANLDIRQVDVGKVLAAQPGFHGNVSGPGNLKLQVGGPSGPEMLQKMTGSGGFDLNNIEIRGSEGVKALGALAAVSKILGGGGGSSGDLAVASVKGDLGIGGGRIASKLIHADTSLGQIDLRGSLGFDQTLAYEGKLTLGGASASQSQAQSQTQTQQGGLAGVLGGLLKQNAPAISQVAGHLAIPFTIHGTLNHPEVLPGGSFR